MGGMIVLEFEDLVGIREKTPLSSCKVIKN